MRLETIHESRLADAPKNANRMAPAKYAALVDSLRRLGFVQPILARELGDDTWEIVDGHHRVRGARELGVFDIPAVVLEGSEDPRLVALALNRLRGETDLAAASLIIDELLAAGSSTADLVISGFSERELSELVDALSGTDEPTLDDIGDAEVPDPVGAPAVRPFLLELTFRSKADLVAVRRALRKAAGKGNDLADGMLRLVQGE